MNVDNNMDRLMGLCLEAAKSVPDENVEKFIELLLTKKKIFIYGSGRSGLVGQLFAVRLVQIGLDVYFVGDMTTPIIGKDDLTVLISNTGHTMSVVQTAEIARRIGSHVVSVTSSSTCKLAHVSNSTLVMKLPSNKDVREIAPLGTVFEDAVIILFDSIIPRVMAKMGVDEDAMRGKHAIWV